MENVVVWDTVLKFPGQPTFDRTHQFLLAFHSF